MQWLIQIEPTTAEGFPAAVDAAEPANLSELTAEDQAQVTRAKNAAKALAEGATGTLLALLEGQDTTVTVQVKGAETG